MIWFFAINFGLLVFLDIEPAYKLLWFVALWLSTVIKVSKDMNGDPGRDRRGKDPESVSLCQSGEARLRRSGASFLFSKALTPLPWG